MQPAMQILEERIPTSETYRTIADKRYAAALTKKWGDLLEGIPVRTSRDQYVRDCVAVLMENQMIHLKRDLSEDTRSANVGGFTKFIFPLLRRVFPNLIAHDIVSVQPMTAPIGAIFFLDFIYGTNKGPTQAGNIFPRDFDRDYTSEFINGEILGTGNGTLYGGGGAFLAGNLLFFPVRGLDATRGYSAIIREVSSVDGSTVQQATDNGSGGFTFSPAGGVGVINYSNGAISGFKFNAAPGNGNQVKAYYFYDGEASNRIPQAQMDVKKAAVEARPRRLKALWSAEAAEDLKAFQGIDAEGEMVAQASQEIALEIDREIINDILAVSTSTTDTFDVNVPVGISQLEHLRAMITKLSSVSGAIHKKTQRGPANWIVTSPEISALLSQLTTHTDYRSIWVTGDPNSNPMDMPRPLAMQGQFGVYKVGTLQNKWILYEDPFMQRDVILMGLKGQTYLDCGYVFAPYIPLQITPLFLDPNDMSYRKGMRTRYASKVTRPEYFGQIRVNNL